MMSKGLLFRVAACAMALLGPVCFPDVAVAGASATEPLSIITRDGTEHRFRVEVVRTPEAQARGLMFRESLAADAGMLFVEKRERRQVMWMKNTLIPLDMLFIRKSGSIARIHQRAVPGSVVNISSRGPVLAVLELPGGTVSRLKIRRMDTVRHAAFDSGAPDQ